MSDRFLPFEARIVAIVLLSMAPVPVAAQGGAAAALAKQAPPATWTPPRTPDGQPDLQGIWANNGATPLERPKALEGRQFLTDEEVSVLKQNAARLFSDGNSDFPGGDNFFLAALANPAQYKNPNSTSSSAVLVNREFDNRTSLIVDPPDGRVPSLAPDVQRRAAAVAARQLAPAGPEDLSNFVRCITFGVPRLGGNAAGYNSYYQFVQTPGYVVFAGEVIHDARIIPLDGRPHLPQMVRQWHGDSRGRWEGDTLVVDTTNFSAKSNFMGSSEHLHLIERFTRIASDTISYEITLDDPTTWTRPWTAVIRLKQTADKMYEYACHEGNLHTMGGILAAARADDKVAQADNKTPK